MNILKKYPPLHELPANIKKKLREIKCADDIKSTTLDDTFLDDHILCGCVTINGIRLSVWWCGPDVAAFEYADESRKAKQDVFDILKDAFEDDDEFSEEE